MDRLQMRVRKFALGAGAQKNISKSSQGKKASNLEYQSDKLRLLALILGGWGVQLNLDSYRAHQTNSSKHIEEVLAVVLKLILQVGETFIHNLLRAEDKAVTNDKATRWQTARSWRRRAGELVYITRQHVSFGVKGLLFDLQPLSGLKSRPVRHLLVLMDIVFPHGGCPCRNPRH